MLSVWVGGSQLEAVKTVCAPTALAPAKAKIDNVMREAFIPGPSNIAAVQKYRNGKTLTVGIAVHPTGLPELANRLVG
jgi:hypothetical protein